MLLEPDCTMKLNEIVYKVAIVRYCVDWYDLSRCEDAAFDQPDY